MVRNCKITIAFQWSNCFRYDMTTLLIDCVSSLFVEHHEVVSHCREMVLLVHGFPNHIAALRVRDAGWRRACDRGRY